MSRTSGPRTLLAKIWEKNLVRAGNGGPDLMYVDLHLVHEVTSPQAFEGLTMAGRRVRRPDLTFATVDHNVPTTDRSLPIPSLRAADSRAPKSSKTALNTSSLSLK